jgi:hypothetical protein
MNFDELQKTWARQTITGERVNAREVRERLAHEVRQRGRAIRRIIGVAAFLFVTGWAVGIAAHFTGIQRFNRVTLTTFVIASLFDLAFLALGVRAMRRMQREAIGMGETLADSLRVSLRAVELQMRDCALLGYGLGLALVLDVGMTLVRYFTGNLPRVGAIAGVVLTTGLVAAIGVTLRRYYRGKLVPRREELTREVADLGV